MPNEMPIKEESTDLPVSAPRKCGHVLTVILLFVILTLITLTLFFWIRSSAAQEQIDSLNEEIAMYVAQQAANIQADKPNGSYEDEWVSFEYPSDVLLEFRPGLEGANYRRYDFLYMNEDQTWSSTGYSLTYPRKLTMSQDGAETFDDLVALWSSQENEFADYETGMLNGRTYLKVEPGGLAGDDVTYYIQGEDPNTVYRIDGAFLHDPQAEITIATLLETLSFDK